MLTAAMTRKHARHWREMTAAIREEATRHFPAAAAPREPGAWGYIRVSREEQVESGLSLEHQAKVCQDIYRERVSKEVPFMELLADEAASAFRKQSFQREKGRRLLTELQAGDYLIFLRMNRAVRNIGDLLRILKVFEEREINVLVAGGRWDYSTADGRFMLHVMAAMTQWESEIKSERIKAALAIRKGQGKPIGGPGNKRIGYKLVGPNKAGRRYIPDWEQRAVMARIAELHERDGLSFHAIGRLLEAERCRGREVPYVRSAFQPAFYSEARCRHYYAAWKRIIAWEGLEKALASAPPAPQ